MCKYTISFICAETSQLWRLQIFYQRSPRPFWTGCLHKEDSCMALSLRTSHNNCLPWVCLGKCYSPSLRRIWFSLLLLRCISCPLSWLRMC